MKPWPDVENLCSKHDVILLLETCLTKQNLSILFSISPDHFSFAFSPVTDESGIRRGRPYEERSMLWNQPLKSVVEVCSSSGFIIGIKISGYDRDLLIANCSAVFSALFKIQTRTHLLVIYVRCLMYLGLLVYFIRVIIAKVEQFNLYKTHYLTSSCFSNSSNPVA